MSGLLVDATYTALFTRVGAAVSDLLVDAVVADHAGPEVVAEEDPAPHKRLVVVPLHLCG